MEVGRTTLSKFLMQEARRLGLDTDLTALLNDVQTACKYVASAVGRGVLAGHHGDSGNMNIQGEEQKKLDVLSNELFIYHVESGGHLAGMASEEMDEPLPITDAVPRGPYLLVFDPLDGSSNLDINMSVGSIFSVLRSPDPGRPPAEADFLQTGTKQVAAGYALYGPSTMMVLTLGDGTHGFTLDREIGAFILTHPHMKVPAATQEFAINTSNERFWEPPVARYVEECIQGKTGPREKDFNMRWVASMVAEVHRILMRGGLFMYPKDTKDPSKPGRLRLMYEANPMAMLIEQAGGRCSTGRERMLDVQPTAIHQRIPVILGSREEVDRLDRYHHEYDTGQDKPYKSPLFNTRSLFSSFAPGGLN